MMFKIWVVSNNNFTIKSLVLHSFNSHFEGIVIVCSLSLNSQNLKPVITQMEFIPDSYFVHVNSIVNTQYLLLKFNITNVMKIVCIFQIIQFNMITQYNVYIFKKSLKWRHIFRTGHQTCMVDINVLVFRLNETIEIIGYNSFHTRFVLTWST